MYVVACSAYPYIDASCSVNQLTNVAMQTWKVIVSYFWASGFCVEYEMYVYFAERLWHNAGTVRFIYFCPYRAEVDVSNIPRATPWVLYGCSNAP